MLTDNADDGSDHAGVRHFGVSEEEISCTTYVRWSETLKGDEKLEDYVEQDDLFWNVYIYTQITEKHE